MRLEAGAEFSHYRLVEKIGQGGMGVVWKAQDVVLDRAVAIKFLPPDMARDDDRRRMFLNEARLASSLNNAHIAQVYELAREDNTDFIVMEYIEGNPLSSLLQGRPLPPEQVSKLGFQVAQALSRAHHRGLIHRDIKPANILVTPDGDTKIVDFGLAMLFEAKHSAWLTESATTAAALTERETPAPPGIAGTVPYMSPEQVRGQDLDARTDVFSVGVVLYEMTTGRRPFLGATSADVIREVLACRPVPVHDLVPTVPHDLDRMIRKALAARPADRYQTMEDLAIDLKQLGKELEIGTSPSYQSLQHAPTVTRRGRMSVHGLRAWMLVAGAVMALGAGGLWIAQRIRTVGGSIDSLAVLPFVNSSADPGLEYLSDGLSESIAHNLSQVAGLKVMSRGSVMRYKGRNADARIAGKELGVRAVLLGTISVHGQALALSVELVDADDRRLLWGERYTRRLEDALAMQVEIARQITEKLRLQLTAEEELRVTKQYTSDPEAYRLYLKGRFHSLQWTTDGWKNGIEYLTQAVALDPNYALAYAGLSACYYDASGLLLPPNEAMPKAKLAAQKALGLDDTLAEAHCALGAVLSSHEWDRAAGRHAFERAIELNPSLARAHMYLAVCLLGEARTGEAIAAATHASELDPLSPFMSSFPAYCHYLARDYDTAIDIHRRVLETHPDFVVSRYSLGMCYLEKQLYDDAITSLQVAQQQDPEAPYILSLLAHTKAQAGKREEALRLLGELQEMGKRKYVDPFDIARVYVALGNWDETFKQLEQAYDLRSEQLLFLTVDPEFDDVRTDPRFTALLHRIAPRS